MTILNNTYIWFERVFSKNLVILYNSQGCKNKEKKGRQYYSFI